MVEGFKDSDVGLIPNDWTCEKLPIVVDYIHGKAHEQFVDDNGEFVIVNSKFISSEGDVRKYSNKNFQPGKVGDVLTVLSDLPNGKALAKCFFVDKENVYAVNQRVCIWRSKGADPYFLYHVLNRNKYFLNLNDGVSQTHILNKHIEECPIQVPPTKAEQTAIATALNDADALITALEKLIAKKKAIKQGAMQELLRPKARWVEKNLGKSATLKARIGWQGLTTAEYKETGEYFLITGTDFKNGFIDWQNCVYVEKLRYDQDNNIQVKSNDVLVTKDGTIGKVAFINEVPKPATLNSGVFVIRPIGNSFHPKFFYYILLSEHFAKFLGQLSAGSTINHLYQKDFVSFDFWTPKTIHEQREISEILFDMDSEIEELEQKLAKQKQIKQGMMQVLLTGKKRLV